MNRDLVRRVCGILLGAVAIVAVLSACGGSTPTQSAPTPRAAAPQPTPTAAPARTPTSAVALTPTAGGSVPASPAPGNKATDDLLAKGKLIYEKTAGGAGCASCHGLDGKGTTTVGAPDIRGASEARVRGALAGGVAMMSFIKLNDEEITAVVAYLQTLK